MKKNLLLFTDYQNNMYIGETPVVLHLLDFGNLFLDNQDRQLIEKYSLKKLDQQTRESFDFNQNILIIDVFKNSYYANYEIMLDRVYYDYLMTSIEDNEKKMLYTNLLKTYSHFKPSRLFNLCLKSKLARSILNPIFKYKIKNHIIFNLPWNQENKMYFFAGNQSFFLYFIQYINSKDMVLNMEELREVTKLYKEYCDNDSYYDNYSPESHAAKEEIELAKMFELNQKLVEKHHLENLLNNTNNNHITKTVKKI